MINPAKLEGTPKPSIEEISDTSRNFVKKLRDTLEIYDLNELDVVYEPFPDDDLTPDLLVQLIPHNPKACSLKFWLYFDIEDRAQVYFDDTHRLSVNLGKDIRVPDAKYHNSLLYTSEGGYVSRKACFSILRAISEGKIRAEIALCGGWLLAAEGRIIGSEPMPTLYGKGWPSIAAVLYKSGFVSKLPIMYDPWKLR